LIARLQKCPIGRPPELLSSLANHSGFVNVTIIKYLQERTEKASKQNFGHIMDQVPDVEPEDYDKL